MNYKKMVQDINKLVDNDFSFDMELKLIPNNKKYTQEESLEMANLISKVFGISHCLTCEGCGIKYKS